MCFGKSLKFTEARVKKDRVGLDPWLMLGNTGASGPHRWPQALMHFCFYSGCLDGVQVFHHDRSIVGGEFAVNKNPKLLLTRVFYKALACFLIWKIRCYIGLPVNSAFLTKMHNQIIPQRCYIPCMSAGFEMFILMECKCECAFKKCCFLNLRLQQKKKFIINVSNGWCLAFVDRYHTNCL